MFKGVGKYFCREAGKSRLIMLLKRFSYRKNKHLTLHVFFGGRDAAKAAIGYGRAWAMIGAMMPVLENTFRIDERDVGAYLDYELEEPRLLLDLDVRMHIGTALVLALGAGVRLLGIFTKTKEIKKKAVQANEPSSL